MKEHTFTVSVPELDWSAEFTIDYPETEEEYRERFDSDPLTDAMANNVVRVQGTVRNKRRGGKNTEPITDMTVLQDHINSYKVGKREISPASVRATTKVVKDMDEEQRVQLAGILELVKDNPEMLTALKAAAEKKAAASAKKAEK